MLKGKKKKLGMVACTYSPSSGDREPSGLQDSQPRLLEEHHSSERHCLKNKVIVD